MANKYYCNVCGAELLVQEVITGYDTTTGKARTKNLYTCSTVAKMGFWRSLWETMILNRFHIIRKDYTGVQQANWDSTESNYG